LTVRQNPVRGPGSASTVTAVNVDVKVDRRAFLLSLISWETVRYGISGSFSTLTYIALTLLVSGPLDVPIQIAIPVSYVVSVLFNYSMQRWFVFAHSDAFALSPQAQFVRYVQIGAAQYALTALATAVLPDVLGLDEQVIYVATALIAAAITFVVLRLVVFHGGQESGA
jgi:putative flippase GtrA